MSRIKYVIVGGIEYPILFSQRTLANFEDKANIPITKLQDNYSTKIKIL